MGPPPLRPVGTDEADTVPHVLVDGARRPSTALLLSHWPGSVLPEGLARDLSAESSFAYLRAPWAWGHGASVVTCDHLDEDGLVSLYALAFPGAALEAEAALVSLARAGDFDVLDTLEAGRGAWGLRTLLDPGRSPLAGLRGGRGASSVCARGVPGELLDLVGALAADPGRHPALWAAEDAAYGAGRAALEAGRVRLEEHPEVGLLVATCDEGLPASAGAAVGHGGRRLPIHPAVLHGATEATRILVVQGRSYTYYDRYETWVAYVSRDLPPRRDLTVLAARLGASDARWTADPPSALVPVLASDPSRPSRLSPERLVQELVAHLVPAPAAWLPHRGHPAGEELAVGGGPLSRSGAPRGGTSGRARPRWRDRRRGRPSA